jgi:AcrR family transcriptional regulator
MIVAFSIVSPPGTETIVSVPDDSGVAATGSTSSARRTELLEAAYRYVLEHGLSDMSLRPLAAAIGSSPRVLLFLFGSKDGLVRELLARARADEEQMLAALYEHSPRPVGLRDAATQVWTWLSSIEHRPLLNLWLEGYARSLTDPTGPWSRFAAGTVADWMALLSTVQPPERRAGADALTERTLTLAVLRGALLDLLATGDLDRTTAAVQRHLDTMTARSLDG